MRASSPKKKIAVHSGVSLHLQGALDVPPSGPAPHGPGACVWFCHPSTIRPGAESYSVRLALRRLPRVFDESKK